MEEILASIRRIISEDSQNAAADSSVGTATSPETPAPSRAYSSAADPRLDHGKEAPPATIHDRPGYGRHGEPADASPDNNRGKPPFDLTDTLPGASPVTISPVTDFETSRILDLTNEVRDFAGASADASDVMDLYDTVDAPSPPIPVAEPETRILPSASGGDDNDAPLLTPRAEAATANALNRLYDASERRHEVASAAPSDSKIEAMIEERIDSALAIRLQPLLMQKIDALLGSRIGPALNERLGAMLNDRVGPLLDERLDPALRDGLNAELRRRVDPLLDERLPPALRERLEPALRERLDPILRERLEPMLRDWLDRNLPGIVERVVEREIDRLSRHAAGS